MSDRFVLLGLARSRQQWFSDLARWSTSAVAPIEYVKCLTADEARAVIGSGRRLSALLVDAAIPRFDRELVALASSVGAATIVVDDPAVQRDWDGLGCAAVLGADFGPEELIEQLVRHAVPVDRSSHRMPATAVVTTPSARQAPLIGVTGPGGTGASTVAMALAQASGGDPDATRVALVDGARIADLAMYHDVGDVIPGLPELVEAHRSDEPDPAEIRRVLFSIEDRGYHLLLGQRRASDSAAMRPHSIRAAIDGLRRSFDLVVVDHDPELDGEPETGSIDIEEWHAVSRSTAESADLILLVGRPGVKGLHDLIRLVERYSDAGVPRDRLVPVVNWSPRNPAARAAATNVLAELTRPVEGEGAAAPAVFLRHQRSMEDVHRSAARIPEAFARTLGHATRELLGRVGPREVDPAPGGIAIRPGELGTAMSARTARTAASRPHGRRSDVA